MPKIHQPLLILACALALCTTARAPAQDRQVRNRNSDRDYGQTSTGRYPRKAPPPPSGVDQDRNSPGDAGRPKMDVPTVDTIQQAEDDFHQIDQRLRADVSQTPEMRAAVTALSDAHRQVKSAEADVVARLMFDPQYRQAYDQYVGARKQLDQLRPPALGTWEIAIPQATDALHYGSIITRMKADALRADDPYQSARASLADATTRVWVIAKEWEQVLSTDVRWTTAKKAVELARQSVQTTLAAMNP